MRSLQFIILFLALFALSGAKVYFSDNFENGIDHWVVSDWKSSDGSTGKFVWSSENYPEEEISQKGLSTSEDSKFYTASTKFPEFSNENKTLVIQYSLKLPENLDCGGQYIKLYPAGVEQEHLSEKEKYNIMFGPDICGTTKNIHVILEKNGKNHLIKKDIRPEIDAYTHLYTLVINPNNKYEVFIDGVSKQSGHISDDWDILPPKTIPDPSKTKPKDWVEEVQILDPEDKKPEGYDDIPSEIVDINAVKPDDWDSDSDGEWEAPMIRNPEYKGPWKQKKKANPDYKGPWVAPMIDNPDFYEDNSLYLYKSFGLIGIEVWQVKSGSVFGRFLITDNLDEAIKVADSISLIRKAEKSARQKIDQDSKSNDSNQGDSNEDEL